MVSDVVSDDRDHIHADWKGVSGFLGLVLWHTGLAYVRSKTEEVTKRVWTRAMMQQESM